MNRLGFVASLGAATAVAALPLPAVEMTKPASSGWLALQDTSPASFFAEVTLSRTAGNTLIVDWSRMLAVNAAHPGLMRLHHPGRLLQELPPLNQ